MNWNPLSTQGISKKLRAFTLVETLVTLALTSVVVTMGYTTLTFTQKLMVEYRQQNHFLGQFVGFKNRMAQEVELSRMIIVEQEGLYSLIGDSGVCILKLGGQTITMENAGRTDTFELKASKIEQAYEHFDNTIYRDKVIRNLSFETEFSGQKFNFYFYKKYPARVKLDIETGNMNHVWH